MGSSQEYYLGGSRHAVTVWPDGNAWIIDRCLLDATGAAISTTTLDVQTTRREAIKVARKKARDLGFPAYEQTGVYGFTKPIELRRSR